MSNYPIVSVDRSRITTGGSISIDRRTEYRERVAAEIEKDPLGFYIRAERGRKLQLEMHLSYPPIKKEPPQSAKILRLRKQA